MSKSDNSLAVRLRDLIAGGGIKGKRTFLMDPGIEIPVLWRFLELEQELGSASVSQAIRGLMGGEIDKVVTRMKKAGVSIESLIKQQKE